MASTRLREGWAVTDTSPRRPWRGRTVRWWLLGKVEDGWKEDDCRVFHRNAFLRPDAGYRDSLPGKGRLGQVIRFEGLDSWRPILLLSVDMLQHRKNQSGPEDMVGCTETTRLRVDQPPCSKRLGGSRQEIESTTA